MDRLLAALGGRYALERKLGEGGMATVYLGHDLKHDRPVALKLLRPEVASVVGQDRFRREIRIAANLAHPHILPLHDSGEVDGVAYYVMPYVRGESLRQRLDRERQLPLEEALRITRDVADALAHAHDHGIIHRDIKPENILLSESDALVADFGIARPVTAAGHLTESGVAIGTPAYMSPEQLSGELDLDARTDVYALGCVLYEMLAGEAPFTGSSVYAIASRAMTEAPQSIHALRPAVPAALDGVIAKALAAAQADRYTSIAAFHQAVDVVQTAGTTACMQIPRGSPWRVGWQTHATTLNCMRPTLWRSPIWVAVPKRSARPSALSRSLLAVVTRTTGPTTSISWRAFACWPVSGRGPSRRYDRCSPPRIWCHLAG